MKMAWRPAMIQDLHLSWWFLLAMLSGYKPTFPASYITEFKRPTLLPAKLQAVLQGTGPGTLSVAVLTEKGDKEVIKGQISAAPVK
jgi:hypothetical protein